LQKNYQETYFAKPFNFFIFPRSAFGIDKRFIVQSSSATFLAGHKFDFNKTIYEGIGYLSKDQENAILKKQEDNASTPRNEVALKEQDVKVSLSNVSMDRS